MTIKAGLACMPEIADEGDTVRIELHEPSTLSPVAIVTSDGRILAKIRVGESVTFVNRPSRWQRFFAGLLRRPSSTRWVKKS